MWLVRKGTLDRDFLAPITRLICSGGWSDNNTICVGLSNNTLEMSRHSGSFQSNRVVERVVKGIDKFDGVSTLQCPGSACSCNHRGTAERHRPQYFQQNAAATVLFVFHFVTD